MSDVRECVLLSQMDIDNVPRPMSTTSQNTLSNLRTSISRRIQFRRSVRLSVTAAMLPVPASAGHDDDDADTTAVHEHYVSVEHQMNRHSRSADNLESNSTDAIAARYADHRVPNPPTVSAQNRGDSVDRLTVSSRGEEGSVDNLTNSLIVSAQNEADTTRSVPECDSIDLALPVTMAPTQPHIGQPARLMTSVSTSGSVGGATATGIDADYLAVTVDQQLKVSVSKPVSQHPAL